MKNYDGALGFDAFIADADFNRTILSMNRKIDGLSQNTLSQTERMGLGFRNLSTVAASALAGMGLAMLPAQIVKIRGEFQQLEIALNTMLGSKAKADQLMGQIVQFAALTPYGLKDTAEATKMLLAYGAEAETVIDTMRRLGDIASGIGAPLKDIAWLYGTTMTQGRLYTQDLNQFLGRGIPMTRELAKIFGVAENEVKGLVEAGKVGFPEVQKVIENLTNSGSMFGGLMEAQSKSLVGLQAQLGDAIDAMFNDIGRSQEGVLSAVFQGAIATVENYEKVIDVLKVVVATYGAYRAALILTAATEKLSGTARLIFFHAELAKTTGVSTVAAYAHATALGVQAKAQAALNAVMAVNPFVAGATAAVALAAAIWYLHDSTTAQEKAQESLNDLMREAENRKEVLSAKTSKLVSVIRDETQTRYAQTKAFGELQKLYPAILSQMQLYEFRALNAADAQRMFNAALDEMGKTGLKSNFEAAVKKVSELEERLKKLNASNSGTGGLTISIEKTRKELEAARIEAEKLGAQIKEEERLGWLANATNEEKLKYYNDQVDAKKKERGELEKIAQDADAIKKIFAEMSLLGINKEIGDLLSNVKSLEKELGTGGIVDGGNKAYWEKIKKDAEDSRNTLGIDQKGSAEWKRLSTEIENADKKLQAYSTTVKKSKKSDEVFLPGSIKGLEQAIQKAREQMEKLPGTDQSGMQKQQDIIIQAEQRIAEIRKSIAIRSFEEEIAEKQRQYELYERWVQHMGEDAAKEQFSALLTNGASFSDYLQSQMDQLTNKGLSSGFSDDDLKQLDSLKTLFNDFSGETSPLQKFQKGLDDVRDSSGSLTEEIIRLKEIQDGLDKNDNSSTGIQKRLEVAERLAEATKERKYLLDDFLRNVAGSEQRRLAIEKRYADLRNDLDARTADKKSEAYLKALKRINDAEKKELDDDSIDAILGSKAYKELEHALALTKRNDTGKRLELLKKQLSEITKGTDEYLQKLQEVKQAEIDHKKHSLEAWSSIAGIVGDLGSALEGYEGAIGQIGGALSGLASAASRVSTTFANMDDFQTTDGKMSMEGYAAAAQNIISIITGIIGANQKRIEAERQFATERLGFENDYALQLNQNLGNDYKKNPFYQDYEGMIKAGVDQYEDAFNKYQSAIDKLEEGRAKERQKNVVDGKTTLGMVGSGAAAGAVIGTAIGGWAMGIGTVVGTIVGGVVGLVSGLFSKKKKDVYGSLMEQYPELVTETAEGWAELNVEMAKALITNNQVDDKTKQMLENAIALNEEMQNAKQQIQDTMVELTGQIGDNLRNALVEAFRAGDSAAQALHKTVSDIIADVTSKLLFSSLVGPVLDQLVDDMTKSLTTGDGSIVDDLVRFDQYGMPAVESYFDGLSQLEEWAKNNGFDDIFGRSQGAETAMQGQIKGMTEETASVLVGQFNAVRIYQAEMNTNIRISVLHLQSIAQNTAFNRYLVRLEAIENHLADIKRGGNFRGAGL